MTYLLKELLYCCTTKAPFPCTVHDDFFAAGEVPAVQPISVYTTTSVLQEKLLLYSP